MADEIYRKKECELCGKYSFEKHLGTTNILDGGFTRTEKFEESGFGDLVISFWGIKDVESGRRELRLCPECASKIDLAITKVITELKREENL